MKVIYPGSFHPPTLGHIDIIRRAAALFDEVIVAVMVNSEKKYLFPAQERMQMLKDCLHGLENVRVTADDGLLARLCEREKADAILRSVEQEVSSLLIEMVGLQPTEEGGAAHGTLDYAVFDFHIANFPRSKQGIILCVHEIVLSCTFLFYGDELDYMGLILHFSRLHNAGRYSDML